MRSNKSIRQINKLKLDEDQKLRGQDLLFERFVDFFIIFKLKDGFIKFKSVEDYKLGWWN